MADSRKAHLIPFLVVIILLVFLILFHCNLGLFLVVLVVVLISSCALTSSCRLLRQHTAHIRCFQDRDCNHRPQTPLLYILSFTRPGVKQHRPAVSTRSDMRGMK